MRSFSIWRCAAATIALFSAFTTIIAADADNPPGQSTFVSPDNDLGFAFTIGNEDVNDYFVTMRMRTSRSWAAIGLGSHDMTGALYFVMYINDKGDNVTLSPRLAYGNYEPFHYDTMRYEYLNATRIEDGWAYLSFRCIECQNWPGGNSGKGYLDLSSNSQKCIWALGPKQRLRSNDERAGLRYHESHGVFSIDMARTKGTSDAPVLTDQSRDEGTTKIEHKTKLFDVNSAMHAALMTLATLVLFPLGIGLLRIGRWTKWHGVNQTVALIIFLAGAGLGVATSFHYQRIVGLIVLAFLLGQFALGIMHHRDYQQTRSQTKYGRIHAYMGNGILIAALLNMIYGYFFAKNFAAAFGISVATLTMFVVALLVSLQQARAAKKRRIAAVYGAAQAASYGDGHWTRNDQGAAAQDATSKSGPQPKSSPAQSPWKSGGGRLSYEDEHELEPTTSKQFP